MNPNLHPERFSSDSEPEPKEPNYTKPEMIGDQYVPSPPDETTAETLFQPPARVQADLEANEREYSAEFDRLDGLGIYNHYQIRKMLAKKGLRLPPTPEEAEKEELARMAAHAESVHEKKPKRTKTLHPAIRYVSSRDAGPPPHIAEQMRGKDS